MLRGWETEAQLRAVRTLVARQDEMCLLQFMLAKHLGKDFHHLVYFSCN